MAANGWRLKGEYFESCNCEVLCPCIVRGAAAVPTEGHCDVALAFHIQEGESNGVQLGGLNFIACNYTPGPMAEAVGLRPSTSTKRPVRPNERPWNKFCPGKWAAPPSGGKR